MSKRRNVYEFDEIDAETFHNYLQDNKDYLRKIKDLDDLNELSDYDEDQEFNEFERIEILERLKQNKKQKINENKEKSIEELFEKQSIHKKCITLLVYYEKIIETNDSDKLNIFSFNIFCSKDLNLEIRKNYVKYKYLQEDKIKKIHFIKKDNIHIKLIILNEKVKIKSEMNIWNEFLLNYSNDPNIFKSIYEDIYGINQPLFKKEFTNNTKTEKINLLEVIFSNLKKIDFNFRKNN